MKIIIVLKTIGNITEVIEWICWNLYYINVYGTWKYVKTVTITIELQGVNCTVIDSTCSQTDMSSRRRVVYVSFRYIFSAIASSLI